MKNPAAPATPPPNFIPDKDRAHALGFEKTPGTNLVLPTTVMPCLYSMTYVWLKSTPAIWIKPIAINQSVVTSWVWNGRSWYSSQVQLKDIDSFICKWF